MTSGDKLNSERLQSSDELLFICVSVNLYLRSCLLINRGLDTKGPKQPRQHTPLRTLREVNTRAYASAGPVSVVIAILIVDTYSIAKPR
jgi:hypothetical protein